MFTFFIKSLRNLSRNSVRTENSSGNWLSDGQNSVRFYLTVLDMACTGMHMTSCSCQCHHIAPMSVRCHYDVMCLLDRYFMVQHLNGLPTHFFDF